MIKKIIANCLFLGCLATGVGYAQKAENVISREDSLLKIEKSWESNVDAQLIKLKKLEKLKISGYVHAQIEFAQQYGKTKVGNPSSYKPERDFDNGNFFRFGLRRSRIKVAWEEQFGTAVFQMDLTEKGFNLRDAYVRVSEPWLKTFSLTVGIFDRPFGDEISYSSSLRESPERSKIYTELFPNERDLGAKLTIAAPKKSKLYGLKLDASAMSGNSIVQFSNKDKEAFSSSKMDFIGHLKYDKKWEKYSFGIGASMYYGTVNNADTMFYTIQDKKWVGTATEANENLIRQYYGVDAQFSVKTKCGLTQIRGEYIIGNQPSISDDFTSPLGDITFDASEPYNYLRKFQGWHAYYIQGIYNTPLKVTLKYGYNDPNTEIKKNEIVNAADISYHSFGVGLVYDITSYIRVMAYYEINVNEKSDGISVVEYDNDKLQPLNYNNNLKDNVFTLRLQFKY